MDLQRHLLAAEDQGGDAGWTTRRREQRLGLVGDLLGMRPGRVR
jgi:hypothetical protein